ncbi:MAG: phosphonate C-P lyase system protein PhnH [Rhodopila sp.]
MNAALSPGFAEPVADAQACFRSVLDAMAHPGRICRSPPVAAPDLLCTASAAVLLALVDQETPLWLDPVAADAQDWITFHTSAPLTDRASAAFALAFGLPDMTGFPAGSDEAPETSVTLIVQVRTFSAGVRLELTGPGLRELAQIQVDGLPADFPVQWAANRALFPRGVDLLLCAGDELLAMPRSVTVRSV